MAKTKKTEAQELTDEIISKLESLRLYAVRMATSNQVDVMMNYRKLIAQIEFTKKIFLSKRGAPSE